MPTVKQANRSIELKSALADDTLLLKSVSYRDALARPFQADFVILSEDPNIKLPEAIGEEATVRITPAAGDHRYIHGIVAQLAFRGVSGRFARYEGVIVPRLWLLSRTTDCRIFQHKSIPEIVSTILDKHSIDFQLDLAGSYEPWEYCVQYRETDLDFVLRLLEHEGIYFFFEHKESSHKMIIADAPGAHLAVEGAENVAFHDSGSDDAMYRVRSWSLSHSLQPTKLALNDYDFKGPRKDLLSKSSIPRDHAETGLEIYDSPGKYVAHSEGDRYAKIRLEELHTQYETISASADYVALSTGFTFELERHPRADQNRKHLVTSVSFEARSDAFESGPGAGSAYSFSFDAIPADTQFRPRRSTRKPTIPGPQTALVVGPAGSEIDVDEHGRVRVHFFWDRHDKKNENSSCWIRVSNGWAGKQWGAIYHPRIGQEVIVEFLEGDPDRPIVTGRVYNADNMPPYALPANKTVSTLQSRSSLGGSPSNFNEIKFEDKKGDELLYIQAEKNRTVLVKNNNTETVGNDEAISVGHDRSKSVGNDETTDVGHDRTETVGNNETITIGVDRTETVGSNETIAIGADRTETVGANESITIGAAREETVGATETITIGADRTEDVGGNESITIGGNRTETVGGNESITVGGNQSVTVAKNRSSNVGSSDSLNVSKKITINAGDQISITTGSASIVMKKDGTITIKGKNISIQGSGKINVKADGNVIMKGQKILQN